MGPVVVTVSLRPAEPFSSLMETASEYFRTISSPTLTCARFLTFGPTLKVTTRPIGPFTVTVRFAWSTASIFAVIVVTSAAPIVSLTCWACAGAGCAASVNATATAAHAAAIR